MKAYVEYITGGLVRIGAGKEPEPYQYSVTYDDRGLYAVIKGFFRKRLPKSEFELIIRTINEASGKLVAYYRAGTPLTRVTQVNPVFTKGKIVMHKHHVNEAKNHDGTINQDTVVQHVLEACIGIVGGTLKIVSMEQEADPHHPKRIKFTFEADAV